MTVTQNIDGARETGIGREGITAAEWQAALVKAAPALDWLRARHADGALPLLRLPERRDDLAAIREAAERLSIAATDIVILGTAGSSLGGQTLAQLADHGVPGLGAFCPGPRLHFIDNLDGDTYGNFLTRLPLPTTRFVAI